MPQVFMARFEMTRKGFSWSPPSWRVAALFLPLWVWGTLPAPAQYIPPPATQSFVPPSAAGAPETHAPRAKTRAERRAEPRAAREARAQARAEQRHAKTARIDKTARATDKNPPPAVQSRPLVLLAGDAQSARWRAGVDLLDMMRARGGAMEMQQGDLLNLVDDAKADLAIVQSDALDDARRQAGAPLVKKLVYLARLYHQEVHLIARGSIQSLSDLDGSRVATAAIGTPEEKTARRIFERLGIAANLLPMNQDEAVMRIARAEIDAALIIGGKPVDDLRRLQVAGLHLVKIPYKAALQDDYYPARLSRKDYPDLIKDQNEIETIALGTILIARDPANDPERTKKLAQFTTLFFEGFAMLRAGAHHPKWREINLAADVPGWRRFAPAQKWLDEAPQPRVTSLK